MTRDEFLKLHTRLSVDAGALMSAKNADYGANDDPFRNFRMFGLLGILVRMSDKLARLRTFVEKGTLQVKDESALDTVLDIINYAVLFEAYRQDGNVQSQPIQ